MHGNRPNKGIAVPADVVARRRGHELAATKVLVRGCEFSSRSETVAVRQHDGAMVQPDGLTLLKRRLFAVRHARSRSL